MSIRKNIFSGFFWRIAYFIIIFLINVLIARIYGAETSGWLYFISNNLTFLILIFSFSLESAIVYFGSSNKISENKLFYFSLIWLVTISIVFSLLYIKWCNLQSYNNIYFLKFAGLTYFFGIIWVNFFSNFFYIKKAFSISNKILIVINLFLLALIPNHYFHFFSITKETYLYIYYAAFAVQGLVLFISYIIYNKKLKIEKINISEVQQLFKYAYVALFANIVSFLMTRLDYWYLHFYKINSFDFGNYVQATKLGQVLLTLALIISAITFPYFSNLIPQSFLQNLYRIFRLIFLLFIIIFIVFFIFGNKMILFIYGSEYIYLYKCFLLLIPGIYFMSIITILASYFAGIGKPSINLKIGIITFVFIALANFYFIPSFGIYGAAFTSSFGYLVCLVLYIYYYKKFEKLSLKCLFSFKLNDIKWLYSLIQKTNV